MAVSVGLIAQTIEKIAPKSWAEDWDNVGLLVGDSARRVERIILTLDATHEVVEEAKERKAQLILAHHPIMFKPLKNLRSDNQAAQIPMQLLKAEIGYYAAHTNLDQSVYSSSWTIGNSLGLERMEILAAFANEDRGYGVIGYLPASESLESIVNKVEIYFDTLQIQINNFKQTAVNLGVKKLNAYRMAGKPEQKVRKIAIVNGSGGSFVPKALFKGADLLITGDVDHHEALDAKEAGMAVLDIGHYTSEIPMIKTLADYLKTEKNLSDLEIMISRTMHSPWD
ncbi:Nif3-like dinuclear metal center hexameric protein [Desulfitobacterium sp. AusDCA]|uniref:Nif3-like dinuclear metal center hexameric protein n=1 Tax=Desulfitobacterium sp. AusDCA TaxID=3240383 RepID=UPI003DA77743